MRYLLASLLCLVLAAPAAAMPDTVPAPRQDLRSPDTRDAALGRPVSAPAPAADAERPWALVGGGLGVLLAGGLAARRRVLRLA